MSEEASALLYQGKSKKLYPGPEKDTVIIEYTDGITAGNGAKKEVMSGKGAWCHAVSNAAFRYLAKNGVSTQYIRAVDETHEVAKKVSIIPLEVVVRNVAAGSFAKRYGVDEGGKLSRPTVEYSYKRDDLGDPLIPEPHILALELANEQELAYLSSEALKINQLLKVFFEKAGLQLVDFKLEFGKTSDGSIVLADEISPDTCRLWDLSSGERLDKDRFRRGWDKQEDAYIEVVKRIKKAHGE